MDCRVRLDRDHDSGDCRFRSARDERDTPFVRDRRAASAYRANSDAPAYPGLARKPRTPSKARSGRKRDRDLARAAPGAPTACEPPAGLLTRCQRGRKRGGHSCIHDEEIARRAARTGIARAQPRRRGRRGRLRADESRHGPARVSQARRSPADGAPDAPRVSQHLASTRFAAAARSASAFECDALVPARSQSLACFLLPFWRDSRAFFFRPASPIFPSMDTDTETEIDTELNAKLTTAPSALPSSAEPGVVATPAPRPRAPRIGLVLGSGAARGWAHIGVIRALERSGIRPDLVCGTSAGAPVRLAPWSR